MECLDGGDISFIASSVLLPSGDQPVGAAQQGRRRDARSSVSKSAVYFSSKYAALPYVMQSCLNKLLRRSLSGFAQVYTCFLMNA